MLQSPWILLALFVVAVAVVFFRYAPVLTNLSVSGTLLVYRNSQIVAARGLTPWEVGNWTTVVSVTTEHYWLDQARLLVAHRGLARPGDESQFEEIRPQYSLNGAPNDIVVRIDLD